MLFAEISVGVGNERVVRFPRVAPLFLVLEASFAWRLSGVRVHAFSLSGRKERGNPGLKDTILSGLGMGQCQSATMSARWVLKDTIMLSGCVSLVNFSH